MEILDWLPALFASSVVAAYALVFAAAVALIVFLHRGDSLLGRASERQDAKKRSIRDKARHRRETLLASRQKKNIKELAALTRRELKQRRDSLALAGYHEALMRVSQCVKSLDFEGLSALHALVSNTPEDRLAQELDAFLHQEP